jgi:hypothetical protein
VIAVARQGLNCGAECVLHGTDVDKAQGYATADGLGYGPDGSVDCASGAVDANNHRP